MAGTTQVSEEMAAEDAERQAVQDWSQGGQAFALRDISNGGIAAKDALLGNPWSNRAIESQSRTCEGRMTGRAGKIW